MTLRISFLCAVTLLGPSSFVSSQTQVTDLSTASGALPAQQTGIACPGNDGADVMVGDEEFEVFCGYNITGLPQLFQYAAIDEQDCLDECGAFPECVGATYDGESCIGFSAPPSGTAVDYTLVGADFVSFQLENSSAVSSSSSLTMISSTIVSSSFSTSTPARPSSVSMTSIDSSTSNLFSSSITSASSTRSDNPSSLDSSSSASSILLPSTESIKPSIATSLPSSSSRMLISTASIKPSFATSLPSSSSTLLISTASIKPSFTTDLPSSPSQSSPSMTPIQSSSRSSTSVFAEASIQSSSRSPTPLLSAASIQSSTGPTLPLSSFDLLSSKPSALSASASSNSLPASSYSSSAATSTQSSAQSTLLSSLPEILSTSLSSSSRDFTTNIASTPAISLPTTLLISTTISTSTATPSSAASTLLPFPPLIGGCLSIRTGRGACVLSTICCDDRSHFSTCITSGNDPQNTSLVYMGSTAAGTHCSTNSSPNRIRADHEGHCTPDGSLLCSDDGSTFMRCVHGGWINFAGVAAGTRCVNGMIVASE